MWTKYAIPELEFIFQFQTLIRKTGHKACTRMSYKAGITAFPEKQKNVVLMTKLTESQTHTQSWTTKAFSSSYCLAHKSTNLSRWSANTGHRPLGSQQVRSFQSLCAQVGKNKAVMHLESYLSRNEVPDEENRKWREQTEIKSMKVKLEREKTHNTSTKQMILKCDTFKMNGVSFMLTFFSRSYCIQFWQSLFEFLTEFDGIFILCMIIATIFSESNQLASNSSKPFTKQGKPETI